MIKCEQVDWLGLIFFMRLHFVGRVGYWGCPERGNEPVLENIRERKRQKHL